MFENDTAKNIVRPTIIFNNWDNANGFHDPLPALNKTTNENIKTTHIGINKAHEKRDSFSLKFIIFALDTRVVDILF